MGVLYSFDTQGEGGRQWYGASYPLGATRYYSTSQARDAAVSRYVGAIESTGGYVLTVKGEER